ncbi:MAG: hypothetical protein DRH12_07200 [Deltaproteobacteria bacterium]|nr:MAG: hypothetical protein DRH12_07200 [Deltaproteobacteria bacterium]
MEKLDTERLTARISRLEKQVSIYRNKLREARSHARLLAKKARHNEMLLNEIPGYLALLQDGKILFANKKILSEFGYEKNAVVGRPFEEFIHEESLEFVKKIYQKRIQGKTAPDIYDLTLVDKWGQSVPCEARVGKIRHNGRRAFLVTLIPLKNRKKAEARRLREEKLRLISHFSQGIARQLQLCASLLEHCAQQGRLEKNETAEPLQALVRAKERTERIITVLGTLHKDEDAEQEAVELAGIIQEAQEFAKVLVKHSMESVDAVSLETFIRAMPVVNGSPDLIKEAIGHVIANALEASPRGRVLITLEEHSGQAHIYIQDNGRGIPEEERERIFDPFYTSKPNHLGVGLSLAAAIFRRYGGEVSLISRPGHGASFVLSLPALKKPPEPRILAPGKILKKKRIVLVDNDDPLMGLVAQVLKGKGATVFISSLNQALRLAYKGKADTIIVGIEDSIQHLAPFLRKISTSHAPPLICLLSRHQSLAKEQELAGDLQNVILMSKPFNMDHIVREITRQLTLRFQSRPTPKPLS